MDDKPSNNADSLAISLQKVKHLLRKPGDKSKPEQPMDGNEEPVAKILRYNLRSQAKIEHGEQSVRIGPNEKNLLVGNSVKAMNDSSSNKKDLLAISLEKVKHLLRKPGQLSASEQQMDENILLVNGKPVEKSKRYNLRSQTKIECCEKPDPTQPNGMNLMELDDDCLLELLEYLKPMEVAHCAYVNVRLNKLIKRYIQTKYKIRFSPNFDVIAHNQMVRINVDVLQAFFCIFGKDIVTLTLRRNAFDDTFNDFQSMGRILRLIQDYCYLKEMTLIGFGMCGLNEQFCSDLKSLTLSDCSVTREWRNMKQLTTLKLNKLIFRRWPLETYYDYEYGPRKPIPLPFDRFGALTKVQLSDVNIPNEIVVKLINSNRNIRSLSITKCFEITPFICGSVSSLRDLEEFEYKTRKASSSYIYFQPLTSLQKLKVLKLFHGDIGMSKLVDGFVENGVALEHLELGLSSFADETAMSIAKMQSIKVLKLNETTGLNESHITSMATQLGQLEELQVKMKATISQNGLKDIVRAAKQLICLKVDAPGFIFDADTYQTIAAIIQERTVHNKLELTIYGNGNQLAVPNEILSGQNEKWFTVKELNRKGHQLFEDLASTVGHPPPPPPRRRYYYSDSDDSDDSDYYY